MPSLPLIVINKAIRELIIMSNLFSALLGPLGANAETKAPETPKPKVLEFKLKANNPIAMQSKLDNDRKKMQAMAGKLPQLSVILDVEARQYAECAK